MAFIWFNNGKYLKKLSLFILCVSMSGNIYSSISNIDEEQHTIVFVGDLITEHYNRYCYVENLSQMPYWNNLNFVNSGIRGFSVNYYYQNEELITDKILKFNPTFIMIYLGLADASWYKNETYFTIQYEWLIEKLIDENPQINLLIVKFSWAGSAGFLPLESHVQVIEDIAIKYQLPYADVYSFTKKQNELFEDGVHPNALGAYNIAWKLNQSFVDYIKECVPYPAIYSTEKVSSIYQTNFSGYCVITALILFNLKSLLKKKWRK